MARDDERIARIRRALGEERLDALVCALPSNVLLLSGYWPFIGNAIAIATREGAIALVAPKDEERFVAQGWADAVETFTGGSLDDLRGAMDRIAPPLSSLISSLGLQSATIGVESGGLLDPSRYAATFHYGPGLQALLQSASSRISIREASGCLAALRSTLTPREVGAVRHACDIARNAYAAAVDALSPGMSEQDVAAMLRSRLADPDCERCDGFAYCMSGPNASRADAAFQHSTPRAIADGDGVLLHCNSYCWGFWTDITRTFWTGEPGARQRTVHEAVLAAGAAAFAAIRPGVHASAVDCAARETMARAGCAELFTHSTGHGVGFTAIDHNARPRIHPRSEDVLEPGMVFNIEPAAYLDRAWGIRHCDLALVTENGGECLTPWLNQISTIQSFRREV